MNALLLAGVLLLGPGAPDAILRDFRAANERALAGEHDQAIALYRSLLERGYEDGGVYYNLGHVLEDAGRSVEAIVAYERALARDPSDEEARENLRRLRARTLPGLPEASAEVGGLSDVLSPLLLPLPIGLIGWAAAIAWLLAFLLFAVRGPRAGALPRMLVGFAGLGLVVVALRASLERDLRAVVLKKAIVREGPDPRFAARGDALPGEPVRILGRQGSFREVKRRDGQTGWVEADVLEMLR